MTALLRAAGSQLPVVAFAALAGIALMFLAAQGSLTVLVVSVGFVGGVAAAVLSGNVRLFCLWGLILAIPFDLSYRLGPVYAKLGGETSLRVELSDLFWLPVLAFMVRDIWIGKVRGVRIPKVMWVWAALGMLGVVAVIVGPWRMTAFHEMVRMVKVALIFIVLCNELRTPERIMHAAMAIAVAVMIQAAAGITQYLIGSGFGLEKLGEADVVSADNVVKSRSVTRIGAFMLHPVIFATFLATLLPIAVGMALIRCGRARRMLFVATILMGVPALILTLSRAGWLTFAVCSVVLATLVMFRLRLARKAVLPLAAAAVVVVAVGLAFAEPIMARVFQSKGESERGRDEWAQDAQRMISARPILGFGMNSYAFAAPPYTRLGERGAREFYEKAKFARSALMPVVHNAYLQWLAEMGVVGLGLHLLIFAMLLHLAWRNLRVRHEQMFILNAACFAALVGYLVDLWFGNSLRQGSTLREFWVLAALVCSIHYWRLRYERAPTSPALPPPATAPLASVPAGR